MDFTSDKIVFTDGQTVEGSLHSEVVLEAAAHNKHVKVVVRNRQEMMPFDVVQTVLDPVVFLFIEKTLSLHIKK
ncbi:unnamed protein product [Caenorhabditis brenneri]